MVAVVGGVVLHHPLGCLHVTPELELKRLVCFNDLHTLEYSKHKTKLTPHFLTTRF